MTRQSAYLTGIGVSLAFPHKPEGMKVEKLDLVIKQ